ncbi:MAG TPA: pirin family protein [Pseudonocardiaceae bacterium]|nr:pirin family protein [Pseudonocardiaceae bacterium]
MSNVERLPDVVACATDAMPAAPELLRPRTVPLGGPRAMTVRRTLPQRSRTLIGAWCFVDHYGPDEVARTGGMGVAGHPHTGLQTVTWLFAGEVEHRDTIGTASLIRPGEVNLMTAGRGIAHSEYSTPGTTVLHGAQLWVALPERDRRTEPAFEHFAPEPKHVDGARLSVFIGSLTGTSSPVRTRTPLLGAELRLSARAPFTLDLDPTFEHGFLVDTGQIQLAGTTTAAGELCYLPTGTATVTVDPGEQPARLLLLGGAPLNEHFVMWWNFIGGSHEDIVAFRGDWQDQLARHENGETGGEPFGAFPAEWGPVLPAPTLPNARLKIRP